MTPTEKRIKIMQFLAKKFEKGVLKYYDYEDDAILIKDRADNKLVFRCYEKDNGLSGVHKFISASSLDGTYKQVITV